MCKDGERERERAGVLCGCEYVRDERCVEWGRVCWGGLQCEGYSLWDGLEIPHESLLSRHSWSCEG